jgi:hypothetical protein
MRLYEVLLRLAIRYLQWLNVTIAGIPRSFTTRFISQYEKQLDSKQITFAKPFDG